MEAASAIARLCVRVAFLCIERSILFSIENPRGSYLWDFDEFRALALIEGVEDSGLHAWFRT